MIRNIFLPEKIGANYILAKRILGVTIGQSYVNATFLVLKGTTVTVKHVLQESLNNGIEKSYEERVAQALKNVVSKVGTFDELRSTLTNSPITFKELSFPFADQEKIDLIVRYEVEPYLPFAAHEAVVDFIVTRTDQETLATTVQVAAVQKKYIQQHLDLFVEAGIDPHVITVDVFNLYGAYRMVPNYYAQGACALLDIGMHNTKLLYMVAGQLKRVRVIDKGLYTLAQHLNKHMDSSTTQAVQDILRFGMLNTENPRYTELIKQGVTQFAQAVQFTIDSCAAQMEKQLPTKHIILTGMGCEVSEFAEALGNELQLPCELFDTKQFIKAHSIQLEKQGVIAPCNLPIVANALPSETVEYVNLRKDEFAPNTGNILLKQLIIGGLLLSTIIVAFATHNFLQRRNLEAAKRSLTQEVLKAFQDRDLIENERSLPDALKTAIEKVEQEEEIWFAFSGQTRFSFLKYLQSLSGAIDRQSLQLQLERLEMTENTIAIKGEVPSYDKLKIFVKELEKSDLFVSVPQLQELKFDERLTLKKSNGTP